MTTTETHSAPNGKGISENNIAGRPDLQPIIDFVVAVTWAEKIFLLEHETHENPGADSYLGLLIVIPGTHLSSFEGLLSSLEIIFLRGYRISFSLVRSRELHQALSEGHLFFSFACKAERLIYDNGLVALPTINSTKLTAIRRKAEHDFFAGFEKAAAFLDGASFFLERKSSELAAFMLHQAAEGTYRTVIQVLNGMEKKTHCIRSLTKHCRSCAPQLSAFFPADNWQEERLLKLIEDAYLDTRYRDTYEISDRELNMLFTRVERLHRAAKRLFEERIACLAIQ